MGQDTHQWRSTDPAYLALGCGTSRSTSYGSVCWILELPGGIVMHSLARHCRTCICIRNSFIHLLINRRWQPTTLGDLWMLDLRTWTWQQLPNENGPEPRSGIVVALVQMMSESSTLTANRPRRRHVWHRRDVCVWRRECPRQVAE